MLFLAKRRVACLLNMHDKGGLFEWLLRCARVVKRAVRNK